MAHSPLTLAALATSAVSDLQVTGYHYLPQDEDAETSAILDTSLGEVLVQVPTSEAAEVHHSAKILGQSALTDGVRDALPFDAPRVLGVTRFEETRAMVSTYLTGDRFEVESLHDDALLCGAIAHTIAAIHSLPRSVVTQQGLRVRDAQDARVDALDLVERAWQTGLLPSALYQQWNEVLEQHALWDFQPGVIHGNLSDATLLVHDDTVTGVLDWSALSVGDPAQDFAWLTAAPPGVLERVVHEYLEEHRGVDTSKLRLRALLWHQLQLAQWLLHGVQTHNQTIVDDAVELCDALVTTLADGSPFVVHHEGSTLADAEAAVKPDAVPDNYSVTAAFDMLDEDRTFTQDTDFLDADEDDAVASTEPAEADTNKESDVDAESFTGPEGCADEEQATEPISFDESQTSPNTEDPPQG